MVTRDDQHRPIQETRRPQPLDEFTDAMIRVADLSVVQALETVEFLGAHRHRTTHELESVLVHPSDPSGVLPAEVVPQEARRRPVGLVGLHVVEEREEGRVERFPRARPPPNDPIDATRSHVEVDERPTAVPADARIQPVDRRAEALRRRATVSTRTVGRIATALTLERRVASRLRQLPALVEDVEATIVVRGGADPEVRRDAEGPVPALTEIFRKRRETPVEVGMAPIDAVPRRIRPGKN